MRPSDPEFAAEIVHWIDHLRGMVKKEDGFSLADYLTFGRLTDKESARAIYHSLKEHSAKTDKAYMDIPKPPPGSLFGTAPLGYTIDQCVAISQVRHEDMALLHRLETILTRRGWLIDNGLTVQFK